MEMESIDFLTRHSIKPKGEDAPSQEYKGISERGVELAKQRAEEILRTVESLPVGAVLVLGGASEQVRTKSTMEAYGDELKRLVQESGRTDIRVMDVEDMRGLANKDREEGDKAGITSIMKAMVEEIGADMNTKFVIDAPLFLREFGMGGGRWADGAGNLSPYLLRLMELAGNDEKMALELWLENQGHVDGLDGPNPQDIAREQLLGIARLREFVARYLPDRSISIGTVGHSWNTDALAVYLANEGRVDIEGYRNTVGGQMISETEMVRVETDGEKARLVYGKRLDKEIDPRLLGRVR